MKALIFTVVLLVVYGGSLILKNQEIERKKSMYIPTTYDLQKKHGKPVIAETVAKGKFQKFITLSGSLKGEELYCDVSPSVRNRIKVGENARYENDENNKVYTGRVESVSKSPSLLTGLYQVKVRFSHKLPKGLGPVTVDVPVNEVPNALIVSREAVSNREVRPVAFVIKDNKLEKRVVEIAGANADVFWIKSGLNAGETVLTSDSRYFSGGELVQIVNEEKRTEL